MRLRLTQDLILQRLLAEQTLQLAHLVLQGRVVRAGTTFSPSPTAERPPSA
jgi:hypothetical protein